MQFDWIRKSHTCRFPFPKWKVQLNKPTPTHPANWLINQKRQWQPIRTCVRTCTFNYVHMYKCTYIHTYICTFDHNYKVTSSHVYVRISDKGIRTCTMQYVTHYQALTNHRANMLQFSSGWNIHCNMDKVYQPTYMSIEMRTLYTRVHVHLLKTAKDICLWREMCVCVSTSLSYVPRYGHIAYIWCQQNHQIGESRIYVRMREWSWPLILSWVLDLHGCCHRLWCHCRSDHDLI